MDKLIFIFWLLGTSCSSQYISIEGVWLRSQFEDLTGVNIKHVDEKGNEITNNTYYVFKGQFVYIIEGSSGIRHSYNLKSEHSNIRIGREIFIIKKISETEVQLESDKIKYKLIQRTDSLEKVKSIVKYIEDTEYLHFY